MRALTPNGRTTVDLRVTGTKRRARVESTYRAVRLQYGSRTGRIATLSGWNLVLATTVLEKPDRRITIVLCELGSWMMLVFSPCLTSADAR